MQNFGTHASHTVCTDSKIAWQKELSSQPASTTGNVLPSITPSVNLSIAAKVTSTCVSGVLSLSLYEQSYLIPSIIPIHKFI
ncbi:hypothetical protein E2C01_032427 [Portunus trituberculatus]|uniref:Uncharacterized protein n=1 Tax=Portunus trituberculatus TaxID=210409 RepID=A0A5B7EV91_PORTR|nr:hypothetical protein [Portunus trituberculatus]